MTCFGQTGKPLLLNKAYCGSSIPWFYSRMLPLYGRKHYKSAVSHAYNKGNYVTN